jgi:opacity protein-like surface antigen
MNWQDQVLNDTGKNMLKKLLIACALYAAGSLNALASPYLGGSIGIQNTESYNGLMASVVGGFNGTFGYYQNYYVAGEIFGDTGSLPLGQNYYRRTNYGYGASFLPGYIFRETILLYLRMGLETFRYSGTDQRFTGGQLGLGLQTDISNNWAIRGEYIYTGAGIIHNFGYSRFNFFKLGLFYKFK